MYRIRLDETINRLDTVLKCSRPKKKTCSFLIKNGAARPYKYRLYFTPISSLKEETPRVYRLITRRKKVFDAFYIDTVYDLEYKDLVIKKYNGVKTFQLSEENYTRLLENA